jgi:hypothetical protein
MPSFLIRRPSLTLAAVGLLSTKQQSPTQLHKMLTEATAWFELKVSVPNAALIWDMFLKMALSPLACVIA